MLLALPANASDQDDAARIRELEARVKRLEAMVQTLMAAEQSSGRPTSGRTAPGNASRPLAELNPSQQAAALPPHSSLMSEDASTEPQTSTPAPLLGWARKPLPQELLPNLGKIGATVSFTSGLNSGPFALNNGSYFGGAVELPLALLPGGRLDYEIGIGLAQANRNLPVTSSVAQVANLTVLNALLPNSVNNVSDALQGTGSAPFAVTANANWKAQVLQLTPFVLKYEVTRLDRFRLRPYGLVGLGTYVTVSSQNVAGSGLRTNSTLSATDLSLLSTLLGISSAFGGSLIGGQIAPAAQLAARKLPAGQGGVDLGVHFGAGLDWRIGSLASLGFDARFNRVPDGLSYHTFAARWGLHF
jgi:hypothetical protein